MSQGSPTLAFGEIVVKTKNAERYCLTTKLTTADGAAGDDFGFAVATTLKATKNACVTPSFANKDCLSAPGSSKRVAKPSLADSNDRGCSGRYAEAMPSSPSAAASSVVNSRIIGRPGGLDPNFYVAHPAPLSRLLQLGVLRLGFFQDGDVRVGVFPEGEEIFIGRERSDAGGIGIRALRSSRLQGIGASHAQMS
jgi:hypothetical protein